MKIRIKKEEFLKALEIADKTRDKKHSILILRDFLLEVKENKAVITTTDLDKAIRYRINCEIIDGSGVKNTVLPDTILKVVPKFTDVLDIEITDKKAIITSGKKEITLSTLNPEEFAVIPEVNGTTFTIKLDQLKTLIEKTSFAVSRKEESRKEFKGLYFDIRENEIRAVGTDSVCLALYRIPAKLSQTTFNIPLQTLEVLKKFKGNDIQITVNSETIKFDFGDFELISLLIQGTYPQYEAVIPNEAPYKIVVKTKELIEALEDVEDFKNKKVKLTFEKGLLTIERKDEIGNAKVQIDCNCDIEMAMCFYYDKLLEGIKRIDSEETIIEIEKPKLPVLIKGVKDENYLYVIMPQKAEEYDVL